MTKTMAMMKTMKQMSDCQATAAECEVVKTEPQKQKLLEQG